MSTRSSQKSSRKKGSSGKGSSGKGSSGKGSSGKGSSGKESKYKAEQRLHLYIAVYQPSEGHYYHWAITIFDEATGRWHTYEATRSYANGPFTLHYLAVDPRSSNRCRQPLTYLATRYSSALDTIIGVIRGVSVQTDPNWNCQNYVLDIINTLKTENFVTDAEYQAAWALAYPFYGYIEQEFGAPQPAANDQRVLSEEYVHDSDEEDDE
jgi:hypothetical protein